MGALDFRVGGFYRSGMRPKVACQETNCYGTLELVQDGYLHVVCTKCDRWMLLAVQGWTIVSAGTLRNPHPSTQYDRDHIYRGAEFRASVRKHPEVFLLLEHGQIAAEVATLNKPLAPSR